VRLAWAVAVQQVLMLRVWGQVRRALADTGFFENLAEETHGFLLFGDVRTIRANWLAWLHLRVEKSEKCSTEVGR
jgi:hypothetical protein